MTRTNPDSNAAPRQGHWTDGDAPSGVTLGAGTVVSGAIAFKRFRSKLPSSLVIGDNCTLDDVRFAVGEAGRISIGHHCYLAGCLLLAEAEIRIGNYVVMGWNVTVADTDFHPVAPADRVVDAVACSPLGDIRNRPPVPRLPVTIEDDVWIGPACAILKGVRIGAGAFVEPGSVVLRDVPPGSRVMGNPARVIEAP